jgi:opacity protein-like surface antigen
MKTTGVWVAGLLATALLGAPAAAPADIGVKGSVAVVIDSGAAFVKETGFGRGWRYGGGLFFQTGKHAGVEIALESFGVPVADGTAGLAAGRMTMTTLLIDHCWYVFSRGRLLPYALTGVGFAFFDHSPDGPVPDVEKGIVDRLALQLGAGLDFRASRKLAICGRVRYNMAKTWVEDLPRTGPIRDIDPLAQDMLHLYGLELGVGIKLSF